MWNIFLCLVVWGLQNVSFWYILSSLSYFQIAFPIMGKLFTLVSRVHHFGISLLSADGLARVLHVASHVHCSEFEGDSYFLELLKVW